MSSVVNTMRNTQGEMGALRCPLYAARQHTVQNKEKANQIFHSLKTINCPAIVSICQDLELLMAPSLNSQLTLTHQLEWDCKLGPYFQEEQFISCLNSNPSLIENQKVRVKKRCGFKVKGLAVICTCLRMETQYLSLQTRFVQNTLVSQNDVSNNIEWQIGLKQQLNMLST